MGNFLLINVDELWLKGGNRPKYFQMLRNHIQKIFKCMHNDRVNIKNENQRFVATSDSNFSKEVVEQLTQTPGIHSIMPAIKVPSDLEAITNCAIEMMNEFKDREHVTFRVNSKRLNKTFEKSSMDTSRWVGHHILKNHPQFAVKMKNAEVIVDIRIQNDFSYISYQKFMAIGGLPIGTSGKVVTLLSGGFDSPVASFLMSKRGCSQEFAFFYAYPFVGEEVKEKIVELAKALAKFQNSCVLHVIPFGTIQKAISDTCKSSYRTLLFRKFMVDTSTALAKKIGAQALVTGDCLGQVSSQTLENMAAIDMTAEIPILRPLLGLNKREIINISEKIGTHDISIIPHDDACALFAPDSPVLRAEKDYWLKYNSENNFSELIDQAIQDSEIYIIDPTGSVK